MPFSSFPFADSQEVSPKRHDPNVAPRSTDKTKLVHVRVFPKQP